MEKESCFGFAAALLASFRRVVGKGRICVFCYTPTLIAADCSHCGADDTSRVHAYLWLVTR